MGAIDDDDNVVSDYLLNKTFYLACVVNDILSSYFVEKVHVYLTFSTSLMKFTEANSEKAR